MFFLTQRFSIHHHKLSLQLFTWFILLLPFSSVGQVIISGKVTDNSNGKPVVNASVFLDKTSTGSITAENGEFKLANVRSGNYELVISIIGFETYHHKLTVNESNIALGRIEIAPKQMVLNEVTVRAGHILDVNRPKYLAWFKEEFLGTSNLALDCKIINPEILYLHFNDAENTLIASSPGFLIIENPDLGYRIRYLLRHFSLNLSDHNTSRVQFEGSVLYENMAGTPAKEQRWRKKRLEVYQNSAMHFLRAVLDEQMEKESFMALRSAVLPNTLRPSDSLIKAKLIYFTDLQDKGKSFKDSLSFWEKKVALPKMIANQNVQALTEKDIIKPTDQSGIYALFAPNNEPGIQVIYDRYHQRNSDEITRLAFRKTYAFFDGNGVFADPDALSISGAWSNNRVAELLPVDYEPEE